MDFIIYRNIFDIYFINYRTIIETDFINYRSGFYKFYFELKFGAWTEI